MDLAGGIFDFEMKKQSSAQPRSDASEFSTVEVVGLFVAATVQLVITSVVKALLIAFALYAMLSIWS